MSSLDRSMNEIGLRKSAPGATAGIAPGFMVALLSLTLGFALSTAIRTLPAIGADMLIRDLRVTPQGLAALVGVFPLAFAIGLLPVGAALDRYGVRPVAVVLVAIITVGAGLAAIAQGSAGMLLAQIVLGLGCCEPFGATDAVRIMVGSDPGAGQFRDVAFRESDGLADGTCWLARRILGGCLLWIADAVADLAAGAATDRASGK